MQREIDMREVSDGKFYGLRDMVKAGCDDCKGCSDCCRGMGSSIVLDPYDVYRLTTGLGKSFDELLLDKLELNVVDGLILPNMMMDEKTNCCVFLNEEGRCSIHAFRPGICRLFPLGRIYDEKGISYFLQAEGCVKEKRSKVKVSKWLDTPELRRNQQYLVDWHDFRKQMQEVIEETADEKTVKTITMFLLNTFFMQPYDVSREFYGQFYERLGRIQAVLQQ